MNVAVSCGGTGGHIFPGLVTAAALRARGHNVALWLAGKAVEAPSVEDWDGKVVTVRAEGLPSGFSIRSIRAAWILLRARRCCIREMRRRRPDVLLAMGSYASVGPVLAARRLGIPIVLHEGNAIPGRAVGVLSRFARALAVAFPEAAGALRHPRVVHTGFPIRPPKGSRFPQNRLMAGRFTVLCMGGSQGARALNAIVPEAISALHGAGVPVQVIHLTGARDHARVAAQYAQAGVPNLVVEFLRDMEQAYSAATLAVCRAGAATCSELAAFGVPALLVPFPEAVGNHQLANARAFETAGAAVVMTEANLDAAGLASRLKEIYRCPLRLDSMRAAMLARSKLDAGERLADLIETIAAEKNASGEQQ